MSNVNLEQDSRTVQGEVAENKKYFPSLDSLFTDAGWRQFAFQLAKEIGAYPRTACTSMQTSS
jgi:hypothetical protein